MPAPSPLFFYTSNGQKHGPCTLQQILELGKSGEIGPDDMVWAAGKKPRRAAEIAGLLKVQTIIGASPSDVGNQGGLMKDLVDDSLRAKAKKKQMPVLCLAPIQNPTLSPTPAAARESDPKTNPTTSSVTAAINYFRSLPEQAQTGIILSAVLAATITVVLLAIYRDEVWEAMPRIFLTFFVLLILTASAIGLRWMYRRRNEENKNRENAPPLNEREALLERIAEGRIEPVNDTGGLILHHPETLWFNCSATASANDNTPSQGSLFVTSMRVVFANFKCPYEIAIQDINAVNTLPTKIQIIAKSERGTKELEVNDGELVAAHISHAVKTYFGQFNSENARSGNRQISQVEKSSAWRMEREEEDKTQEVVIINKRSGGSGCLVFLLIIILIPIALSSALGMGTCAVCTGVAAVGAKAAADAVSTSNAAHYVAGTNDRTVNTQPEPKPKVLPTNTLPLAVVPSPTPTPKVAALNTSPPPPDLKTQLQAAQANVVAAEKEVTKAKEAALTRLRQTSAYQAAETDLANLEAKVKSDRATNDPGLADSSLKRIAAKSKLTGMEKDAVASDKVLTEAQQRVTELTSVANGISNQIAQQEAAEAAVKKVAEDRVLAAAKAERAKNTMSLQANDARSLYAYYQQNEVKADDECKGKWCLVTGKVQTIGKDIIGTPFVSFVPSAGEIFCVQAMFSDKAEINKLKNLSPNQGISIAGKCQGKLGHVILRDCTIVEMSEVSGKVDVFINK